RRVRRLRHLQVGGSARARARDRGSHDALAGSGPSRGRVPWPRRRDGQPRELKARGRAAAGASRLVGVPPAPTAGPLVGVLALQGGFEAHERVLARLGARVREVRVPADLDGLHGLVIPGGESTTMTLGLEREGLAAGLVVLDRDHLGAMDILAQRNAFGRQTSSFETDLELAGLADGPLPGIFIRAPWIAEHGPEVEILAEIDGHGVAARQGQML